MRFTAAPPASASSLLRSMLADATSENRDDRGVSDHVRPNARCPARRRTASVWQQMRARSLRAASRLSRAWAPSVYAHVRYAAMHSRAPATAAGPVPALEQLTTLFRPSSPWAVRLAEASHAATNNELQRIALVGDARSTRAVMHALLMEPLDAQVMANLPALERTGNHVFRYGPGGAMGATHTLPLAWMKDMELYECVGM